MCGQEVPSTKSSPFATGHKQWSFFCVDFLSIEPDSKGIANVLVVTDHYTRYAQTFPAKDQKALMVTKVLFEKFFVHYGLPARSIQTRVATLKAKLSKSS